MFQFIIQVIILFIPLIIISFIYYPLLQLWFKTFLVLNRHGIILIKAVHFLFKIKFSVHLNQNPLRNDCIWNFIVIRLIISWLTKFIQRLQEDVIHSHQIHPHQINLSFINSKFKEAAAI